MTRTLGVVASAIALAVLPLALTSYQLGLLTKMLIFAVFAMSLNLILGYAGLPSLGHAAYFGIGAYTVGLLTLRATDNFWLDFGAGVLAAGITAALFGLLALRTQGSYLLMITLALAQVVWGIAFGWRGFTGGDDGLPGIRRPAAGLPVSLDDGMRFYYFVLMVFTAVTAVLLVLIRSPFGRALVGIRECERRMEVLGYDTWRYKYVAFVEDDVVGTRGGKDRAGGEHGVAERRQIRIEVERKRGVAGQPALVTGADDARLDPHALDPAGDDDAEVGGRPLQRHAEDALGAGQLGREAEPDRTFGVAVAGDARRPASRRRAVGSGAAQRHGSGGREGGRARPEPVGDSAALGAAREDDVPRVLDVGRSSRRHGNRERARHRHGRRHRDRHSGGGCLPLDCGAPGPGTAAGIGERDRLRHVRVAAEEAEGERDRVGEEQRVVRSRQVDDTAAAPNGRELLRLELVRERRVARQRERRLHLGGRPGGMALEQQRGAAGDMGGGHARAGEARIGTSGRGGEDRDAGSADLGLQSQRDRRRPARREARDHVVGAVARRGDRSHRDRRRRRAG
jgi:hypothetical protein